MYCGILGCVQQRAVAAKADKHIRPGQLLLLIQKSQITGQLHMAALPQFKGQAEHTFHPHTLQNLSGLPGSAHTAIPVGVGT